MVRTSRLAARLLANADTKQMEKSLLPCLVILTLFLNFQIKREKIMTFQPPATRQGIFQSFSTATAIA